MPPAPFVAIDHPLPGKKKDDKEGDDNADSLYPLVGPPSSARTLVSAMSNKISEWMEYASRCWQSSDRETPLFGIPSILPSLALGKFLYSPAVSSRAIFETVRCVYDSTKEDILQYESVYPGEGMHLSLHGARLCGDAVVAFWPHNAQRHYSYGNFKINLAPRDDSLNGGDHVILARAANCVGAGASEFYSRDGGISMQDLEKFIMAEFIRMYPTLKEESLESLSEQEPEFDFSNFQSGQTCGEQEKSYLRRIEIDKTTGRMKNCGDDSRLQLIPKLVKVHKPCIEDFHIPDKYGPARAEWVEKHGGGLREFGYKVGYVVIIPLTFNGCIVSVLLPNEEEPDESTNNNTEDNNENNQNEDNNTDQINIYDLQIPFGAAAFIRLDTYFSVLNGVEGNVRYQCLLMTTKTAFVEQPIYFRDTHQTEYNKLYSLIPRFRAAPKTEWARANIYGLDAPVEEFNRFTIRMHGKGTKNDETLITNFLKDYESYLEEGELERYYGFRNMVDDSCHKAIIASKAFQKIADDRNKSLRKDGPGQKKAEWEVYYWGITGMERLWLTLNHKRRLETVVFKEHQEEFEAFLLDEDGNELKGKLTEAQEEAEKADQTARKTSYWILRFSKIGASEEDILLEKERSRRYRKYRKKQMEVVQKYREEHSKPPPKKPKATPRKPKGAPSKRKDPPGPSPPPPPGDDPTGNGDVGKIATI